MAIQRKAIRCGWTRWHQDEVKERVDNAYKFLDFILVPENAAMLSAFARYANGIAGSEAFMPEEMKTAPEVVIPEEFKAAGKFLPTCGPKATEYITAIWTELQK